MQSYVINDENFRIFRPLIPEFFFDELVSEEVIGLGMLDDCHGNEVMGVALCRETNGWLELVWYALSEGYRGIDYADKMLSMVVNQMKDSRMATGIFADLTDNFSKSGAAKCFTRLGFTMKEIPSGAYTVTVDGLKDNIFFKHLDDKLVGQCVSFSELSEDGRKKLSEQMKESGQMIPLPENPDYDSYDGILSKVHMPEGQEPDGAIFIKDNGEYYCISCIWSQESERTLLELISAAFLESKKLDGGKEVFITVVNGEIKKLITKLAPSAKPVMMTEAQYLFNRAEY